jgi:uncharacterized membrane protein YfcA
MTIALALVVGAVIGALLGLLGGGGSIMAVPALVYALGLGTAQAILISLIVVGVASAFGAVPKVRAGQVQWRLAGVFALFGIPATFVGSAIGDHLPEAAVMIGFALVMVVAGIRMLRDTGDTGTACEVGDEGIDWRRCAPRSIPTGFGVGLLTGLETPIAIGTSLVIITANSAGGVLAHLHDAQIDWTITISFVATAIVGSLIAGQLGTKLDTARLRHWFAYLVFVVAAYVVIDTTLLHQASQ